MVPVLYVLQKTIAPAEGSSEPPASVFVTLSTTSSNAGIISGYPDGTFRPDATITRAEMMTLVNRALERVPSDEDHPRVAMLLLYHAPALTSVKLLSVVKYSEKNGDEQWTALRANRDWTLLEK